MRLFFPILVGPSADAAELTTKRVRLSECSSRTLIVRLNHKNQSTKTDIVRGMRVVGDYLDLIVTPIHGSTHEVVMEVQPICQRADADDCGYESGWDQVQTRVLKINGAKTECKVVENSKQAPGEEQSSPAPAPPPPPPPPGGSAEEESEARSDRKESLQRPRRRSEGGATGSN